MDEPRILVVHEDEAHREALVQLLRAHPAVLVLAESVDAAVPILGEREIAFAIVSLATESLAPRLRAHDVPFVVVLDRRLEREAELATHERGAVALLEEPVDPRALGTHLRTFLRLYRQREELSEARRRLQAVMDAAPIGISFSEDVECRRVTGNKTLHAMFGARPGENVSATAIDTNAPGRQIRYSSGGHSVAPEDLPLQRAAREGREIEPTEIEVELPDGRRWIAEIAAGPIRDDEDRVTGAVVVVSDVSERERLQREVRASEARFRAIADAMPQLVWTANARGVVDYYSARAAEYRGIEQRKDGTFSWAPVVHPDDLEGTNEAWREAVRTGGRYEREHRIHMKSGEFRWHISRANPVRDGASLRWFGTATDIHDQKLAEARLSQALETAERAVRGRDQLVSMISHDLRNPLGVIRLQVAQAMRKLKVDPLEGGLSRIERQVLRMDRMIDELLDLARIESGVGLELDRRSVDLVRLVDEVVDEQRRATRKHRIEVHTRVQRLLGEWDPRRLERVVENLVANAIKYSPEGGVVSIELDLEPPERAVLRVRDEGVGIPEADRERIFEWFTRGENVKGSFKGSGIGLAGARQIVQQHGGTVDVQSEVGRGSVFTVSLPLH